MSAGGRQIERRRFLKGSGGVALAAAGGGIERILAARRSPAYAQGTRLHIVRWNDFIPAADVELKSRQIPEASRALGAAVTLETINANDLQPRIASAIQSGTGPDIFHVQHNWTHLYQLALVDVSDVAADALRGRQRPSYVVDPNTGIRLMTTSGTELGGSAAGPGDTYYEICKSAFRVGGRWFGVPHAVVGLVIAYRKSWFREVGAAEFPKTWDELRRVAGALKRRGRPYGQTLGHTFGDASAWVYPLLWSFGGTETDSSGRRIVINSKEAVESVKFMHAFWKEACDESGLAWDDTNNNRAFLSSSICATLNGLSIYIVAKRQADKFRSESGQPMWQDIDHAPLPGGRAGRFGFHVPFGHIVMRYSKNQQVAKDFLRWIHRPENLERWLMVSDGFSLGPSMSWETHPMWQRFDPSIRAVRTVLRDARMHGHAGPPTSKATEALAKYVLVDMYAKTVQGMRAEAAVGWAESELRKIYEA